MSKDKGSREAKKPKQNKPKKYATANSLSNIKPQTKPAN